MPIARLQPDAVQAPKPELPRIEPKDYKSIVQDERKIPLNSLMTYVTGSAWTVLYFSQLLSKHNDLKDIDIMQDAVYQQYTQVKNLELRVTSALTSSYDNETSITTVTGSAHVPSCLIPNVGDIFIASIDNGDDAYFRVTLVERKTFNRKALYYIEYTLYELVPVHPEYLQDLIQKSQRTYYFSKERLIDNLDALVTPHQHEQLRRAYEFLKKNILYYFSTFYNSNYGTILLPSQVTAFYDPLLVRAVLRLVNSSDAPEIRLVNNLNIDNDRYLKQPTLWDALIECDINMLDYINKRVGWVSCNAFFREASFEGLRYSRMSHILYPLDADTSNRLEIEIYSKEALEETLVLHLSHHNYVFPKPVNKFIFENTTVSILPPLFTNSVYLVSEYMYNPQFSPSLLEMLLLRYLKKQSLDIDQLLSIVEHYNRWTKLEQFYFSPLVWILIKNTVGSINV